jgi:hypothetical protein
MSEAHHLVLWAKMPPTMSLPDDRATLARLYGAKVGRWDGQDIFASVAAVDANTLHAGHVVLRENAVTRSHGHRRLSRYGRSVRRDSGHDADRDRACLRCEHPVAHAMPRRLVPARAQLCFIQRIEWDIVGPQKGIILNVRTDSSCLLGRR